MKRLRRFALAAAGLLALAVFAELLAGWLGPAPTRLEAILEIFEVHPTRMWTLRPDLQTTFEGAPLHTDGRGCRMSAPGSPERPVCCLGDSLTFGWGVGDGAAWPAVLGGRLGRRVDNHAVPGYTSWQGRMVLDDVIAERPAVVFISYGVNDVSKARFFATDTRPDSATTPRGQLSTWFSNLLIRSRTWRLARNLAFRRRESPAGRAAFLRLAEQAPVRVSVDEYETNLASLVERVRAEGAIPILVKMPLHLPLPPAVTEAARMQARALFARAETCLGAEAQALYLEGLALDPLDRPHAWALYELCRECGDEAGQGQAVEILMRDEVYDASSLHVAYNRRMDAVAGRLGVPVVDVEAVFSRQPDSASLFNHPRTDPYHPNVEGHRLIAEEAARVLAAATGRRPPGSR